MDLHIGEHQSTINENMPLRSAIYYGRTMEKLIKPKALYRTARIDIPTPEFYVFFNGKGPQPLEQTLYLSHSYLEKTETPMLELKVKVININLPDSHPILADCRPLYEYSWFTWKVREYLDSGRFRDDAISLAIEDCVQQGIMTDFIRKHGSKVRNMLFTEFNMDDAIEVWMEEGWTKGHSDGLIQGRSEGESLKLIQMVCKKLKKGKSPARIAEDLEESRETVLAVCRAARAFAPDYDAESILQALAQDSASESLS